VRITLPYAATNQTDLIADADHPFLRNPLGLEALFTLYDPNCWELQANPKTSSNRLKNLGSQASSLYLGAEPVSGVANIANAPSFDNGKLLLNTAESDRILQGGGANSDFSFSNQAKLMIFWVKPTALATENLSLASRHAGSTDTNFGLGLSSGSLSLFWIWNGSTTYNFLPAKNSVLIQNNQLLQIAIAFEPNGANSSWKTFVNGGQIGIDNYTGNNAIKYNASTPQLAIGVRNPGETFQGYFYEYACENLTVSGNDAAARVLLNYQEMAPFYSIL
jgi:hypothetical protein